MPQAEINIGAEITPETTMLLEYIKDIAQRITKIEDGLSGTQNVWTRKPIKRVRNYTLPRGQSISRGDEVFTDHGGDLLGYFQDENGEGIILSKDSDGNNRFLISPEEEFYTTMSKLPF